MLKRYFHHVLRQNGFEDVDNVYWSLGYCQGDGCSFTATLTADEITKLVPYLYPADVTKATHRVENLMRRRCVTEYVKEADFSVKIIQSGNYVHENSMSVDWEIDVDAPWDHGDDCNELSDTILGHARDVAKKLETAGYGLLEAFSRENNEVWRFKTAKYLFRLSEIEEEPDFTLLSDWDEECFIATCQDMIKGESRITGLKAEVFSLSDVEDEDQLHEYEPFADINFASVSYAPGDRSYGGSRRELICELIHEVRSWEAETETLPQAA